MPRRVLHDPFFKQAKAEGYLARSAYKLTQIQESKSIIHKGDWVLDLGCAPGAWMQVAGGIVGPTGVVVGIDLQEVPHRFPPCPPGAAMLALQGDVYQTPGSVLVGAAGGLAGGIAGGIAGRRDRFDVVLSDMAPNTTGHGDHERSIQLCERVVELLPDLLRRGGHCAIKVFEGGEYPRFLKELSKLFAQAKGYKPEASRAVSREMYVVATGYRGGSDGKPGPAAAASDGLPRRVPGGTPGLTRGS
ncbi:MAG: SAM-dependent methyltransferase [Phycisphaerales bacterium]